MVFPYFFEAITIFRDVCIIDPIAAIVIQILVEDTKVSYIYEGYEEDLSRRLKMFFLTSKVV